MNTDAAVLLAELSGGPALDTRGVHTGSIVSGEQWQWACTLLEGGAGWRLEGGAGWFSLQVPQVQQVQAC